MSTAYDANGGSSYNGAKFALAFYGGYTNGLKFEQVSLGNTGVGTRQEFVPSPQIANGALLPLETRNSTVRQVLCVETMFSSRNTQRLFLLS